MAKISAKKVNDKIVAKVVDGLNYVEIIILL